MAKEVWLSKKCGIISFCLYCTSGFGKLSWRKDLLWDYGEWPSITKESHHSLAHMYPWNIAHNISVLLNVAQNYLPVDLGISPYKGTH
jgi:hypothetical protein